MRDVEIRQLRYFCAVARTGSFTKAAVQERVAQPSLSQQVSKLEDSLGSKLFDRLGRGVQLTEFGRALLPRANEILRQVNEAQSTMETLHSGVGGRLRVGCIPTITPYFLAPKLRDFVQNFPEVDIRLTEEITPNLVQMLQGGELDIAVVSPPVNNPDVICSDLFREPILVATAQDHRLAHAEQIRLPELVGERLLLLRGGHCFRDNALTICNRASANFEATFETNQFSSILPLVAAGFGVSLVPRMALSQGSGCRFIPLDRGAFRRVGYIRNRQHDASAAQKAFVGWLREVGRECSVT